MANLSEWLGALDASAPAPDPAPPRPQPGWLALLADPAGFREVLPFGAAGAEPDLAPAPEPAPELTTPDPAQDALERAYAEGLAAGRAMAEAEAEAAAQRQRALRLAFRSLDEAAQTALSDDLAQTVMALCDAALKDAAIDRDALAARCETAAQRIGGAAEGLTLHLHPDDLALLGEDAVEGWQVTPDPALERGTVLIEGGDGVVGDGPAEWRRAIAAAVRG